MSRLTFPSQVLSVNVESLRKFTRLSMPKNVRQSVEIFGADIFSRSNRYSMPVTGSKNRIYGNYGDYAAAMGIGQINTTGFLFGDEDEAAKKDTATSPDVKNYLQMNATDDKFPILVRREEYPGLVRKLHSGLT